MSCLLITLQLELPFKRSVTLDIMCVCWTVYCECKACVSTVCRRLHILSWHTAISVLLFPLYFTFGALKLFFGRQEEHLACKKIEWWGACESVLTCIQTFARRGF